MRLYIKLSNVQHIDELQLSVNTSDSIMCIVGKNGVGKTTLIRAIGNLKSSDTFTKTASPYIFNTNSRIHYVVDGNEYNFEFNPKLNVIDTKSVIDEQIRNNIYVELPIPHGQRFNHFQKLSEIDDELRSNIAIEKYNQPVDLIRFLSNIYNSDRFNSLKETTIRGTKYYFILKENNFYIREDYLSSGEYFVINLYKTIHRDCQLIVIDEIDVSLDASAQVNLIKELREYCQNNNVSVIFTTHSLPLMKTLNNGELFYMESKDSKINLVKTSYNYVKSLLFGFKGWDKYILTEDERLKNYIADLLWKNKKSIHFRYKIIYIGGGSNVVSIMERNSNEQFFSEAENVISVLDRDQENEAYCQDHNMVLFTPFLSIEKQMKKCFDEKELTFEIAGRTDSHKRLYNCLIDEGHMTEDEIFSFVNDKKKKEVADFREQLINFLN